MLIPIPIPGLFITGTDRCRRNRHRRGNRRAIGVEELRRIVDAVVEEILAISEKRDNSI
jgi:hypothetical protein